MTRATFRFRNHTLKPDVERPDAEPTTFHMQCKADGCAAMSEMSTDAAGGADWAAEHLRGNPTHLEYREVITRPYRFEPEAWV